MMERPGNGSTAVGADVEADAGSDDTVERPAVVAGTETGPTGSGPRSAFPRTVALVGAALLAVVVPLVATLDLALPGREALAVAYIFLVPGVPLALALRLPNRLLAMALAIATSLAVAIIYGTISIVGNWWQPVVGAWAVTLIALVLTLIAILRRADPAEASPERPGRRFAEESPRSRLFRAAAGAVTVRGLVLLALLVLTGLTWWWATKHVALNDAGVLGLLPVAGWRYLLAVVMVGALTAYGLLRRPLNHALLLGCALLVSLVGYATVPVADGQGNVPAGWVHVVFTQYINQNGAVPSGVDARFSWPGFFAASAQLVTLAGTPDSQSFLILASAVNTMAAVPALLVIAYVVTRSWQWSWVSVFIYLLTNWYQQDYFSPQATAFVIYTTVLAALLWLGHSESAPPLTGGLATRARAAFRRLPSLPPGVGARRAGVLGLVLALLVTAIVLGHQLTPLTLIFALVVFTLTGWTRFRLLWLVTALVFEAWFSYGATDYWFGHLKTVFGDLGQVSNSVGAGVSSRLVGDPTYQAAQFVRIGWSGLLFAAAGVGVLLLGRRPDRLLLAGLGLAPFALLAVQSYGGEGVIRCFLYASPLLAPLAAVALRALLQRVRQPRTRPAGPAVPRLGWGWTAATALVLVVAALLLTFTRGLNASFERTPRAQVDAARALSDRVRPGDEVGIPSSLGRTPALPLGAVSYSYLHLDSCVAGDVPACLGEERPRFVLLTLTQERYGELSQSRPPGWLWQVGDQLIASGDYRRVYDDPDAWLLESATKGSR